MRTWDEWWAVLSMTAIAWKLEPFDWRFWVYAALGWIAWRIFGRPTPWQAETETED